MLSIPHLIIIFVVALVVLGPERLPELARTIGKVMGEFRRATGDLRSTFEGHLRDLEREADQRKIGGGSTAATATGATTSPSGETAASPAADADAAPKWPESAAPPMTAAEGTVAAEAPHTAATGAEVVTPETNPEKTGGEGVGAA